MRFSSGFRAALVALFGLAGAGISSAAHADSGTIWIEEFKGGWFIGASGGSGTLIFHGRRYPLSIGGLSAGLVFGGSATRLYGHVSNIRRPSDVAGVVRPAGRVDGQCRPERPGDLAAVGAAVAAGAVKTQGQTQDHEPNS
jgi:hypothetical protein